MNEDNVECYSEWVEYRTEEEKQEAKTYLNLWKKFFLRKHPLKVEELTEQWVERDIEEFGEDIIYTLALKIHVRVRENV